MVKLPKPLFDNMKMMCVFTNKNMTQFIHASIQNQIDALKKTVRQNDS